MIQFYRLMLPGSGHECPIFGPASILWSCILFLSHSPMPLALDQSPLEMSNGLPLGFPSLAPIVRRDLVPTDGQHHFAFTWFTRFPLCDASAVRGAACSTLRRSALLGVLRWFISGVLGRRVPIHCIWAHHAW